MTLLFTLTAVFAVLLGAAFWWIRRQNLAVVPVGRTPLHTRPLPAGCDMGALLMSADVTTTDTQSSSPAGTPGGPGPQPPGAPRVPRRKLSTGPSRREFLRNAWSVSMLGLLGGFGGATLAFLWPNLRGGFGAEIDVDSEETILAYIADNQGPMPYPAGRMWLTEYDPALDPEGEYSDVVAEGSRVMALYHTCVHLGCRVPWNVGPQRFQCPCHGSNYNFWGEYILGPAPRGLDRFRTRTENGRVLVDTAQVVTGPSRQTSVYEA